MSVLTARIQPLLGLALLDVLHGAGRRVFKFPAKSDLRRDLLHAKGDEASTTRVGGTYTGAAAIGRRIT